MVKKAHPGEIVRYRFSLDGSRVVTECHKVGVADYTIAWDHVINRCLRVVMVT